LAPFPQVAGALSLTAGSLVASPIATLMDDGTVAGQCRFQAFAAATFGLGFATASRLGRDNATTKSWVSIYPWLIIS